VISDLTGAGSVSGAPAAAGIQTFVQDINANGGVAGHQINLTIMDDQSSNSVGLADARAAVSAKPLAIVDGSLAQYLTARVPAYEAAGIPVLATSASSLGLHSWLYGPIPTNTQLARTAVNAADSLLGGLAGKKIAFIGIAAAAVEQVFSAAAPMLKAKGASVATTQLQPVGAVSFTSGAANVVASGADAVFDFDTTTGTVIEMKALLSAGYKGPVIAPNTASDDTTFASIASPNFYAMRTAEPAVAGTKMYEAAQTYGHASQTSSAVFALSWIIGQVLVSRLEACGENCNSAQQLNDALNKLRTVDLPDNVLFGPVNITPSYHNLLTKIQLYHWTPTAKSAVAWGGPIDLGQ
jgi:ABC-type branched-subunit amino acid transport system substrate-binding protein